MSKAINILTIGLQIALAFIVSLCLYMAFAVLDSDWGIDGLFGLLFFHPMMGGFLSILTIIFCLLVGLPIRLVKSINRWWRTNYYIAILGAFFGITLLILAYFPMFQETEFLCRGGDEYIKKVPNAVLSYCGWFLINFSILHTFPPITLTEKIKRLLTL